MRKDVKIGMLIGSLLAIAAIVWVSTHPGLNSSGLRISPEELRGEKPADTEISPPGPAAETEPRQTPASNEMVAEPIEPTATQYKELETAGPRRIHTVANGETLSGISQKYYGTASGWQKIYVANRELLSSPDKLRSGMRLIIPE